MNRFIECKFIQTKNKELVPIWELDVRESDDEDGVILSKGYTEEFLSSQLISGYYDLLEKKVVIGKLIEVDSTNSIFNSGEKVLVEVDHNKMTIKTIKSIEINKDRYYSSFFPVGKENEVLKNKNVINTVTNPTNPSIIEIREYCDKKFKFTDGTEEVYEFKIKRLV